MLCRATSMKALSPSTMPGGKAQGRVHDHIIAAPADHISRPVLALMAAKAIVMGVKRLAPIASALKALLTWDSTAITWAAQTAISRRHHWWIRNRPPRSRRRWSSMHRISGQLRRRSTRRLSRPSLTFDFQQQPQDQGPQLHRHGLQNLLKLVCRAGPRTITVSRHDARTEGSPG